MKRTDLQKMQQLLKTATESISEAMLLATMPDYDETNKCKIYVSQQRIKGSKYDDGWQTLFADTNLEEAQKWVDSHNGEKALVPMEYRVLPIDLYID